jgi:hypothetical protein
VPKLALLVPRAGITRAVEFQGNPVWRVAVDPRGKYIAYVDRRRHAMVRVEPATGKVDIDPRWWLDDEKIEVLMGDNGEKVFFWKGSILIRAQWTEHEDNEGYDEIEVKEEQLPKAATPSPADMPEPDEIELAPPAEGSDGSAAVPEGDGGNGAGEAGPGAGGG